MIAIRIIAIKYAINAWKMRSANGLLNGFKY